MTARPIRRNAQTPDRNGKIFYTSTTSLSHISKNQRLKALQKYGRNVDKVSLKKSVFMRLFKCSIRGVRVMMPLPLILLY